jgi:hypothetical protein
VTKHCREELSYEESGSHIDTNCNTLTSRSNFEWKNFARY